MVQEIANSPAGWSNSVRFDLTERVYSRLHHDTDVEVWLICWDIGQDTLLHDHGGSVGAFTVARGSLLEDFGAVHRTGLTTRRHAAGATVGFGADYLHNLVNVGTEPTVSIHAYSPPLRVMNFYCWLPTGMHHLREIPCDTPEPDVAALEAEAATARAHITRYSPAEAADAMRRGVILVDLRPTEYRWRFGEVPGAIAVSRHVLEWRLDATGDHRLKELRPGDRDQEIVLLCHEGHTSSLAAQQVMTQLGLTRVASVAGGFTAWREAGLPTVSRLGQ